MRQGYAYHKRPRGMTVGLLGGSFNPAHEGHRHISLLALKMLRLDQVWWMVSPQNPLKPSKGMAPFEDRMTGAEAIVKADPNILVTDIERRFGTRHTALTLKRLKRLYPGVTFVWLMGADNLTQISKWKDWTQIFESVAIAVFARESYSIRAMASEASRRYAEYRVPFQRIRGLAKTKPPAWGFLWTRLNKASSTAIRQGRS